VPKNKHNLWGSWTLWGQHGCGYSNMTIQIVDQVENVNDEALGECELYWAHQLRAYVENGGQAHSIKIRIWIQLRIGFTWGVATLWKKLFNKLG
jgi:hypothetical protein